MSEIDAKIKEAWKWAQNPTERVWPWQILADAYVEAEAQARKVEAFFEWIINGKQGPSPSLFQDDYIKEVKAELEKSTRS